MKKFAVIVKYHRNGAIGVIVVVTIVGKNIFIGDPMISKTCKSVVREAYVALILAAMGPLGRTVVAKPWSAAVDDNIDDSNDKNSPCTNLK